MRQKLETSYFIHKLITFEAIPVLSGARVFCAEGACLVGVGGRGGCGRRPWAGVAGEALVSSVIVGVAYLGL